MDKLIMLDTFNEDELPCFFRSQYEAIEAIKKEEGLKYLFLTSFYLKWGIDTYFRNKEKKYFDFVRNVVSKYIDIDLCFYQKENGIDLLDKGFLDEIKEYQFIILPTDVNNLFYTKYYKQGYRGHYFCLKTNSFNNNLACVFDNLHLNVSDYSMRYDYFNLDLVLFQSLINDYQTSVLSNKQRIEQTAHQCDTMWYIGIGEQKNNKLDSDKKFLLDQLKNIMNQSFTDQKKDYNSIDKFHIERIEEAYYLGEKDRVETLIKSYMIEVHFSNLYLKILALLDVEKTLLEEINYINDKSVKDRSKLFVMVMARMIEDKSFFTQSLESIDDNNRKIINKIKNI